MKKVWTLPLFLVTAVAIVSLAGLSATAQGPVATVDTSPDRITWQLQVQDYKDIILTVSRPNDFYARKTFTAGSTPRFSLNDAGGQAFSDGTYTYELVVTPITMSSGRLSPPQGQSRPLIPLTSRLL